MTQEQLRNLRSSISHTYDLLAWKRDEEVIHEAEEYTYGQLKQNIISIIVEIDGSLNGDF